MPTIKRNAPLTPEGEYVGQALKVSQGFVKTKAGEEIPIFRLPLHMPDGKIITPVIRVTDSTGWVFGTSCANQVRCHFPKAERTFSPDPSA